MRHTDKMAVYGIGMDKMNTQLTHGNKEPTNRQNWKGHFAHLVEQFRMT